MNKGNDSLDDSEELEIEDLEADGWSCSKCPKKNKVYNSKLECQLPHS